MRRMLFLTVAVAALLGSSQGAALDQRITINATGFVPRDVTVNVGETVTWVNADTRVHQVVVDKTTCNLTIQPAATASCTLRTAGKFTYREPAMRGNAWRGTITVRTPAASVTIAAAPRVVTYGAATTLSGVVSNQQASERVTVQATPCGTTTMSTVGTATTTTGGTWTLPAKPLKTTVYQAKWKAATSTAITVKVRPRATLRKLTRGRVAVRVSAAQSFGGKVVVLQRYVSAEGRWVRVRFVVLKVMSTATPTVISGANVRVRVKTGTRLRAVIGQAQVGSCYVAGTSNVVIR